MFQTIVGKELKTHTSYSANFSENCAVYEIISKSLVGPERLQMTVYGALHAGLVRLHARKHTPAPVNPHIHTQKQACTHTGEHARAHTHTEECNTYCFPRQK